MRKGSKPPDERRKELIDIAARLFAERGYESVSVRDILAEVNGAPGMFYYYFKSKQDIYLATMEDYISEKLDRKCALMEDAAMPFEERRALLSDMIAQDIHGYAERFSTAGDILPDVRSGADGEQADPPLCGLHAAGDSGRKDRKPSGRHRRERGGQGRICPLRSVGSDLQ